MASKEKHSCRLERLTVKNVSDQYEENFEQCVKMLTSLTELEVNVVESSCNKVPRWLELVAPSCRKLRVIDLYVSTEDVGWIRALIANAPLLTKAWLSFKNVDSCPMYPLLQDLATCICLTSMSLRYEIDCVGIEDFLRNNSNLVYLDLDYCLAMTDDDFARILNLPNISTIRVMENRSVRGSGVLNMTSTTLKRFVLSDFNGLTTENQLRILRAFPHKGILTVGLYELRNVSEGFARDYPDLLREFKSTTLSTMGGYNFKTGE